jgi:hypothetical protein
MDGLDSIREALSEEVMVLNKLGYDTSIFDQVEAFVNLSRGIELVEQVVLLPFTDPGEDVSGTYRYAIWEKVAEGIGNLQELSEIRIEELNVGDDEEEALAPDWEILACILRRLRRGITLWMGDDALLWDTAALPAFARAIHGQAMITGFRTGDGFPFHSLDILCSALLTLPALENVSFEHIAGQGPEEGQYLQSMVKLLQSTSLREVEFVDVVFTNTLSKAVAKALKGRSEITDISFLSCSFPEGRGAVIASVLKTNTTLDCFTFLSEADEIFYEVLAAALLSNSTLLDLTLDSPDSCTWLSPLFVTLQANNGLKELSIHGIDLTDQKLSTALRLGFRLNPTLESLNFLNIKSGDNDSCLWRDALSFLRTNTALKALHMSFDHNVSESHAAAIQMEVLAALRENESLETLCLSSKDAGLEEYIVFVAAIQPNNTLKSIELLPFNVVDLDFWELNEDETKYLIAVLKKNYGLEEIIGLHHGAGDIRSIFELNRAGRRYLAQDGPSISKGVDVLSGVSNNINSVFLHLLENPRLCDRSAVEMSNIGNMDNAEATSPGNHSGGKREQQAPSHTGNETRRRLE